MSVPLRISRPAPDDAVGRYFAALSRLGVPCHVPFALIQADGTVRWSVHDHAEADGMGILAQQLESEGSEVPPLPTHRSSTPPGPFESLRHVARYLRASDGRSQPWTNRWNEDVSVPDQLTWVVLDEPTTDTLIAYADARGASLNSLLLWGLHQLPAMWRAGTRVGGTWGVPVNLRGPVQLSNPRANHVSEMPVWLDSEASVRDVHLAIRRGLGDGRYWGPWWVMQQVGRLPDAGLDRFAAARLRRKPEHRLGGLSYLGRWNGSPLVIGRAFAPPVDDNLPIGGGALVYNGRLSLGIRLHGPLMGDGLDTRSAMARWLRSLEIVSALRIRPLFHGTARR